MTNQPAVGSFVKVLPSKYFKCSCTGSTGVVLEVSYYDKNVLVGLRIGSKYQEVWFHPRRLEQM